MLTNEALDSLRKWLANNDKYSHLLSNRRPQTTSDEPRLLDEYVYYLNFYVKIIHFLLIYLDWLLKNYKSYFYKQFHYQIIQVILILIFKYKEYSKNSSNKILSFLILFRYVLVYCFICLAIMTKQPNVSIQPFSLNPM